jgi:hypothetical protein
MSEKRISVLNSSTRATVAYLLRGDGIESCQVVGELNGESNIAISFMQKCKKFNDVTDINNVLIADGKEYTVITPEAIKTNRDEKNHVTYTVTAVEVQNLLGKKFKNISNDEAVPTPDGNSVIILSGGTDLSGKRYAVGSAAHALHALLIGTGWTLLTCDVDGKYDLETEGKSVYENIQEVQKRWGGMLFWDSVNKTVSLRAESKYQPYNGFQIKHGKNLTSLERTQSNDIVTRLYVYGENKLSLKTFKPDGKTAYGKEFIEDYSYTGKVLEGQIENSDIYDEQTLWNWGKQQIAKLCRPQYTYSGKIVDLSQISNYRDAKPVLGDMADVIDTDIAETGIDRKRIIKYNYDFFRPWDCELEIGDKTGNYVEQFVDLLYISKKANTAINSSGSVIGNVPAVGKLQDYTDGLVTQTAKDLLIKVDDKISVAAGEIEISAENIVVNGLATFSNGLSNGSTTINGACIKTGYISGSRIEAGSITASKLAAGSISVDKLYFSGGSVGWHTVSFVTDVSFYNKITTSHVITFLGVG